MRFLFLYPFYRSWSRSMTGLVWELNGTKYYGMRAGYYCYGNLISLYFAMLWYSMLSWMELLCYVYFSVKLQLLYVEGVHFDRFILGGNRNRFLWLKGNFKGKWREENGNFQGRRRKVNGS